MRGAGEGRGVLEAQLRLTRRLLRAVDPQACVAILTDLVRELGGRVAHPDEAGPDAIPVDLSFGEGTPRVAVATRRSPERATLERALPYALEDVRFAVDRLRRIDRAEDDALRDPLTGLLTRRAFGRLLGRLEPGDAVVLLDLDRFKEVNDRDGHAAGDRLLRAFGQTLAEGLRVDDHAARLGGDEFAAGLQGTGEEDVRLVLERLRGRWRDRRPLDVSFSAGIAPLDEEEEARSALARADAALYRSKGRGRDRITVASELAKDVTYGE